MTNRRLLLETAGAIGSSSHVGASVINLGISIHNHLDPDATPCDQGDTVDQDGQPVVDEGARWEGGPGHGNGRVSVWNMDTPIHIAVSFRNIGTRPWGRRGKQKPVG